MSVSQFMGFLKGKSSLMIFDRHANLKYKYVKKATARLIGVTDGFELCIFRR